MNAHIFSGHGQLPEGTNLSVIHKYATVVVKIDMDTGVILECDVPILCDMHTTFIAELVCGRSIENDLNAVLDEINERVHSLSTKAIITSLQVIYNRYTMIKKKLEDQK